MTDNIDKQTIPDNSAEETQKVHQAEDVNEAPAPQAAPAAEEPATATPTKESRNFVWLAVISLILTIAAWVAGGFNGIVAIVISVLAIVAGALSLRSRRNGVRNTAITSIIAAAVLLVVIAAFLTVIYLGMKSI